MNAALLTAGVAAKNLPSLRQRFSVTRSYRDIETAEILQVTEVTPMVVCLRTAGGAQIVYTQRAALDYLRPYVRSS